MCLNLGIRVCKSQQTYRGFVESEILPLAAGDSASASGIALDLSIISRRSIERPGLRYQRRGINKDGGVANFVETEFVISPAQDQDNVAQIDEDAQWQHVASFIQTRGSIPLFWSQSPWSLKPVPVLEHSDEDNALAVKKHFNIQRSHYGPVTAVNLAEADGKEGLVVKAYEKAVLDLNDAATNYIAWDFHKACKGMKYENISALTDQLAPIMNEQNFLWCTDTTLYTEQSGVFRVNCMDCLDRTNVIQSAICRQVVDTCLARFGLFPLNGTERRQLDTVFNELWASNGDAISRQYAGTSALKGDFTRTGKRNLRGLLNDASNSIGRLYQNTIGDFFKQTMIDYVLGENTMSFADFQDNLASVDPRNLHHIASIRALAVETCSRQLLDDHEEAQLALTMLGPSQHAEHAKHLPEEYEEKVVILTKKALYIVSYEYTLQKVRDFTKIPILCISGLTHGTFILSTLSSFARDPVDNYGLIVRYSFVDGEEHGQQGQTVERKANTYSLRTLPSSLQGQDYDKTEHTLVFKAVRANLHGREEAAESRAGQQIITEVVNEIKDNFSAASGGGALAINQQDIRTLADAQAAEGLFARMLHTLENYIWL